MSTEGRTEVCAPCGEVFEDYGALIDHFNAIARDRPRGDDDFIAHWPPYPHTAVTWAENSQLRGVLPSD